MTEEIKKQRRITEDEVKLLKKLFRGNDDLIKLLRKIFLPELDFNAPIAELDGRGAMIDLWMNIPIGDRRPEDIVLDLKARNLLIGHVELMLAQIKSLANEGSDETPAEQAARLLKNSSK